MIKNVIIDTEKHTLSYQVDSLVNDVANYSVFCSKLDVLLKEHLKHEQETYITPVYEKVMNKLQDMTTTPFYGYFERDAFNLVNEFAF